MPDGVIHRDIKPSNVLFDGCWTAKLSDVGLGKILSIEAMTSIRMSASRNMTSKIVGTFSYMDPEYISSGQVCFGSDVYSLGVLLLTMITGKPTDRNMTIREIAEDAVDGKNNSFIDKNAGQWPLQHAMAFVKLALRCAEHRRRSRPDLEKDVLPELEKLYAACPVREAANEHNAHCNVCVVCMDAPATHAFVPCGHRCVCESDADKLLAGNRACPLCRVQATNIIRIYLDAVLSLASHRYRY
mmetsp:Transcript_42224/g.80724  ORF Transcript_42224/g.80724 Transcript_42224/m.80724 type:complete len:243 (+) Transcript_42224:317-1045(+)